MKVLRLLLFLSAWVGIASTQSTQVGASLALLSPCALRCFFTAIQTSQCAITNTTCVCTNKPLRQDAEACLLSSCTIKESLSAMNITASTCGVPVRDSIDQLRATYLSLSVVGLSFAFIRIMYKLFYTTTKLTWDDYLLIVTALHAIPSILIMELGARHDGSGKDIWTVPFDDITKFLFWLYIMEILYISQIAFIKLTLLFFFLRIFSRKAAQILFKYTIVFTILYGLAFGFTAIFQCQPIKHFWNSWDGEHSGHCISVNGIIWVHAGINILLDVWMLAIPLHQVFQLQLSMEKKISISLMFFVGTFVTVVSIVRLRFLVDFASTRNPTWDQTKIITWSCTETNVAVICICMPTMRVMFTRLFPHMKDTFHRTESHGAKTFTYSSGRSAAEERKSVITADTATRPGKSANEIKYTQTFEVQRAEEEEMELMDTHGSRSKSLTCNSRASEASV